MPHDLASWRCNWTILKFASEDDLRRGVLLERAEVSGNLLTSAGVEQLFRALTNSSPTLLTGATGRLGVGDGTGSAADTDTDLGGTNKWWQTLDGTPIPNGHTLKVQATVASGDGNFAWNEFAIELNPSAVASGATVSGILLNHRTGAAAGTKVSGQAWIAQATISIT